LSNEICKRYGLSILPKLSGKEGIDQATIHAKNSWKKDLLKILDKAILNCKSQAEKRALTKRQFTQKIRGKRTC
jgi:hypothetical protein